jgi:hypothetical protein
MQAAVAAALADPMVHERLASLGVEERPGGPAPRAALMEAEFRNWAAVARAAGVRAE